MVWKIAVAAELRRRVAAPYRMDCPCPEDRLSRQQAFTGQPLLVACFALTPSGHPLFFGLRSPGLALVDIVLLWLALGATLAAFARVHRAAAALFAPYLAWVSFAAFLNFTLWRLNS